MNQKPSSPWYGLLAEFEHPQDLLAAAEGAYETGYRKMDAYSPLPIHGLAAAVGFPVPIFPILSLPAVCWEL